LGCGGNGAHPLILPGDPAGGSALPASGLPRTPLARRQSARATAEPGSYGLLNAADEPDGEQTGQEGPNMSDWNDKIIAEFRANAGRVGGNFAGAPLLLLHTTGAKSGLER